MREILLNNGLKAILDEEDFKNLGILKWYFSEGYAHRIKMINGKRVSILMHRMVADAKKGECVDHINGNRLDNRKENLRICTRFQNQGNRKLQKNNTSGYKGVIKVAGGKWSVRVRNRHIGTFKNIKIAAKAYDTAAREEFGEFARTNFK